MTRGYPPAATQLGSQFLFFLDFFFLSNASGNVKFPSETPSFHPALCNVMRLGVDGAASHPYHDLAVNQLPTGFSFY